MSVFRSDPLDVLAPHGAWTPDWQDVLTRAGVAAPPKRFLTRRRLVLVLAVIAVVVVPLVAYAAESDWWFLRSGAPAPASAPVIVKEGDWSGHGWQLVAYPPTSNGLCVAVMPKGADPQGQGAALACAPIAGAAHHQTSTPNMTVTFLSGAGGPQLPAYVVGPVVAEATEVEIEFTSGDTVQVPTFTAPASLGDVRFYATQIPDRDAAQAAFPAEAKLIGYDQDGNVVACLVPKTAVDGVSPLADCEKK